jgi:spore maturation protein B
MTTLLLLSKFAIPFTIGYIVLYGIIHSCHVYEAFVSGVRDGFKMVADLAPTLIGLLVAVGIFRSSGCLNLLCSIFSPITDIFHISPEIFPVAIVRIFSSSAATGMVLDIFKNYGPDSVLGNTISILMSSTETIFYTMSVYFLAVNVTKTRWTLAGALISSLAGVVTSIILGSLM